MNRKLRRSLILGILVGIVVFLLLISLPTIATFITDHIEIHATKYEIIVAVWLNVEKGDGYIFKNYRLSLLVSWNPPRMAFEYIKP